MLDYDSSEEDQFVAHAPLRNTNPVFRTHVPEYINFWGGKPLQNRDFGAVVHERKPWKRPTSDYGTRRVSSRKSSATSSGAEKKVSDDPLAGIGGDAGSGEVGGCQWDEDTRGESARGVGLQDGGGLMRGGLVQVGVVCGGAVCMQDGGRGMNIRMCTCVKDERIQHTFICVV